MLLFSYAHCCCNFKHLLKFYLISRFTGFCNESKSNTKYQANNSQKTPSGKLKFIKHLF